MNKLFALIALSASLLVTGCTTNPYTGESQMAKTVKYGAIASVVCGGIGAIAGGKKGAMIGAGACGLIGAGYGGYTDIQEKKLREQLKGSGIGIKRNNDRSLSLVVPSDITFDTGNANIQPSFYTYLNSIVNSAKENGNHISIVGHTDNVGSYKTNEILSLSRARGVADYFMAQGVPYASIDVSGAGYSLPIASNSSAQGRAKNRRVTITLR